MSSGTSCNIYRPIHTRVHWDVSSPLRIGHCNRRGRYGFRDDGHREGASVKSSVCRLTEGALTILVTGGAGYIGSATVERLQAKGERVVVLDDLFRGHRSAVDKQVPFYQGSVGDGALVERIAADHKISECVHFAALAYVGESVLKPAKYFENN